MTKKILLGLPHYGQVEPEAYFAALTTGHGEYNIMVEPKGTSLLANGFNHLYCSFLNNKDYEYFAMLHADIYPEGKWLDILVDELERYHGDVIHAVVAIKDNRGLTSTAVGDMHNPWEARRLTLAEVRNLPAVFDVDDCQKALQGPWPSNASLLPNTGCLLIKKAKWCYDFPGFTITDRIIKSGSQYVPAVESEDWQLGRWAARNNVRVIASRTVRTNHYGRYGFSSNALGNWQKDETFFVRETPTLTLR